MAGRMGMKEEGKDEGWKREGKAVRERTKG